MSAMQNTNDHLMPAITYANKQIDNFSARKRMTFTELTLIVEGLYAMSHVSGSLIFAYSLASRGKGLVLDERGFFTMVDRSESHADHFIPTFLRDLPYYVENKVKPEQLDQFVPLFTMNMGTNSVILKTCIWVRSLERPDIHIPILLSSQTLDAAKLENKHASVAIPVAHLVNEKPTCSLLQVPAAVYANIYEATRNRMWHNHDVALSFQDSGIRTSIPALKYSSLDDRLQRDAMKQTILDFWMPFTDYAMRIGKQNSQMPRNVIEAITHTMINMQKKPGDLSAQLF